MTGGCLRNGVRCGSIVGGRLRNRVHSGTIGSTSLYTHHYGLVLAIVSDKFLKSRLSSRVP